MCAVSSVCVYAHSLFAAHVPKSILAFSTIQVKCQQSAIRMYVRTSGTISGVVDSITTSGKRRQPGRWRYKTASRGAERRLFLFIRKTFIHLIRTIRGRTLCVCFRVNFIVIYNGIEWMDEWVEWMQAQLATKVLIFICRINDGFISGVWYACAHFHVARLK